MRMKVLGRRGDVLYSATRSLFGYVFRMTRSLFFSCGPSAISICQRGALLTLFARVRETSFQLRSLHAGLHSMVGKEIVLREMLAFS
jgi:hypothetical protein